MTFDYAYRSIGATRLALKRGDVSYTDLTLYYLERIRRFDSGPMGFHAISEINPDVLPVVQTMDLERSPNSLRGLLHGVPIVLKANIDTADNMHTTAGSCALRNSYALRDAPIVRMLRKQGAILLAKASMTEWANGMSDRMPAGFSSLDGQVANPYGTSISPGGSSSGCGVALAADYCLGAIGSDTAGSIMFPATQTGTVGLRPTLGLVSRRGIVPIAPSQDTAGPMARSARDVALILEAIAGPDRRDPSTLRQPSRTPGSYLDGLESSALKDARIGIVRDPYVTTLTSEEHTAFDEAISSLHQCGAVVIDPVEIPGASEMWDYTILRYEIKPALDAYLARLLPHVPVHSLDDVIDYNTEHRNTMLRYGQSEFEFAQHASLSDTHYLRTLLLHQKWACEDGIDYVLSHYGVEAVVFPKHRGAGLIAAGGYPALTIPTGATSDGVPFGFTFVAEPFAEGRLLALGSAWEREVYAFRPPTLCS